MYTYRNLSIWLLSCSLSLCSFFASLLFLSSIFLNTLTPRRLTHTVIWMRESAQCRVFERTHRVEILKPYNQDKAPPRWQTEPQQFQLWGGLRKFTQNTCVWLMSATAFAWSTVTAIKVALKRRIKLTEEESWRLTTMKQCLYVCRHTRFISWQLSLNTGDYKPTAHRHGPMVAFWSTEFYSLVNMLIWTNVIIIGLIRIVYFFIYPNGRALLILAAHINTPYLIKTMIIG